jgi:predicted DNA-binding ribbon-helix-helix protein
MIKIVFWYCLEDLRNPRKAALRIAGVVAEIQEEHRQNANLERCRFADMLDGCLLQWPQGIALSSLRIIVK